MRCFRLRLIVLGAGASGARLFRYLSRAFVRSAGLDWLLMSVRTSSATDGSVCIQFTSVVAPSNQCTYGMR